MKTKKQKTPEPYQATDKTLWTASELAEFFGISQNTIYKWPIQPVTKKAGRVAALYDLKKVYDFLNDVRETDIPNKKNEEALLMRIKREDAYLDLQVKKGKLIDTEEVAKGYADLIVLTRTVFGNLAPKLAPRLAKKSREACQDIVTIEVDPLLNQLEEESLNL